ncbi:MAG: ring-1,2-phenylacetyl-CoA epoxidase subunit PaaE [Flavobacteriales bacterium]|jgi:ring-1,2-phenylacetyl-CoA epoxidase subunit PaaE
MKFHSLPIKRLDRLTADSVRLHLDTSNASEEFNYHAGQYITIRFNLKNEELHRAYSICSAPHESDLSVAVKEVKGGRASSYINQNLREGDLIEVMAPQGNFLIQPDNSKSRHVVLFASGSGITPIISIAKTILQEEKNSKVTLFYGNSNKQTIMFYDELDALAKETKFNVIHVLSDGSLDVPLFNGRINFGKTLELLHNFVTDDLAKEYFICGPAGMMSAVNNALQDNGAAKESIHIEFFENPGQEFQKAEAEAPVEEVILEPYDGSAQIEVTLDDDINTFEIKGDKLNILEAAIKAGIDPPYSCRGGVCTTCRAKLTEGKVSMDSNFALTDEEINDGYILTCQAHPLTKTLKINYDD